MDYRDTLGPSGSGSNDGHNQIVDSDDDGTNWEMLAAQSSQSGSGTKRKRAWPSRGRNGGAAKRKKSNSPRKRKVVRKAKKTPVKSKRNLGKLSIVYFLSQDSTS